MVTEKSLNSHGEEGTVNAAFSAALTPLEDMGLRKRNIPSILQGLADNPYALPQPMQCDIVKKELDAIDTLLGPDIDAPKAAALSANAQYAETGGEIIHDAVVGFVRSQTSIIPLRSIVRRITGANKHEKAVNNAIQAGKLRRAYLRGAAEAKFGGSCLAARRIIAESKKTSAEAVEVAAK